VVPVEEAINIAVVRFRELVQARVSKELPADPGAMQVLERQLHQEVARQCLDPVVGAVLQAAVESEAVVERAAALVAAYEHLNVQKRDAVVQITLLGGSEVAITTPYYLTRPPRKTARKRKKGKRGKEGNGVYPRLSVLGIHYRVSPALGAEVARLYAQATVKDSTGHLEVRGVQLDCKTLCRLTERLAERGLAYRDWLIKQTKARTSRGTSAKGKRLVIGVDGGRLRVRVNRPGRPRKSGRHGFDATWREPKVLVIYEVDEKGRKVRNGLVRYDATMKNADGLFEILTSLLIEIGAHEATSWTFVGDGADWIWDRVAKTVTDVGFDPEKVTEVVDFYHACEHIHEFASLVSGHANFDSKEWTRRMKRLLKKGKVEDVITEATLLCVGRNAKDLRKKLDYFKERRARMDYAAFLLRGTPIGSGAVESAVRRVVNLRFKGNGIYWDEDNVEGMLHLRSQVLAGRWDAFVQTVLEPEAFWKERLQEAVA